MPAVPPPSLLIHRHPRRLDYRRTARDLARDQGKQRRRPAPALVGNVAAEDEQALLRRLVVERLVERIRELIDDRLRRVLGEHSACLSGMAATSAAMTKRE